MAIDRGELAMKNQKGFTLAEILVALVIIAILIFSFTPLTVFSFKQIYETGRAQSALYEQKGKVEETMASRNANTGLPQVTIETVFRETTHNGHTIPEVGPVPVVGSWVSDSGSQSNFQVATVYTAIGAGDNHARIRLAPDSVSEDDNLSGKIINVYSEFLIFDSSTQFKLKDNTGAIVSSVTFTYKDSTTFELKLSSGITAQKSPYIVEMDGTGYSAKLYVAPPNIIAVCSDGWYYTSKGFEFDEDGNPRVVFKKSASKIANNINDIMWHEQTGKYIAVGNSGVYRTLSGGTSWNSLDIGEKAFIDEYLLVYAVKSGVPNIAAIGTDFSGLPVIGGLFDYMERILIGWSRTPNGFLALRDNNSYSYLKYDKEYTAVNDIQTVQDNNGLITLAVGKVSTNQGFVMARKAGVSNNNWFETTSSTLNAEITSVAGGVDVDGKGTSDTADDTASPIFVITTRNGKVYYTNTITSSTNWQQMTLPSGSPSALTSVVCGGDRFVAVGNSNYALVRRNGPNANKSWTRHTICSGNPTFNEVIYINDRFYAVGSSGIYYSTDGESWTQAVLDGGQPTSAFTAIAGRN